jgi:hypothetical protein
LFAPARDYSEQRRTGSQAFKKVAQKKRKGKFFFDSHLLLDHPLSERHPTFEVRAIRLTLPAVQANLISLQLRRQT